MPLQRSGMALGDGVGGSRDSVAMIRLGDVVAHCPLHYLLHRHTVERCSLSQSTLLLLSQPECHGHWYVILTGNQTDCVAGDHPEVTVGHSIKQAASAQPG